MNTRQILNCLRKNDGKSHYLGVYPADRLPQRVSLPCAIIVNMDKSTNPGSHWVAIYIDKHGVGEFFCSFGNPPINSHHFKFIKRNSLHWTFNKTKLQCFSSTVCGQYCIFYLFCKIRGFSLKHILSYFSKECLKNDTLIKTFYKKKC